MFSARGEQTGEQLYTIHLKHSSQPRLFWMTTRCRRSLQFLPWRLFPSLPEEAAPLHPGGSGSDRARCWCEPSSRQISPLRSGGSVHISKKFAERPNNEVQAGHEQLYLWIKHTHQHGTKPILSQGADMSPCIIKDTKLIFQLSPTPLH